MHGKTLGSNDSATEDTSAQTAKLGRTDETVPTEIAANYPQPEQELTEPLPQPRGDDAQTDLAVEDILHDDTDAVLEPVQTNLEPVKLPWSRRAKRAWLNWWQSPWKRWLTLCGVAGCIAALMFVAPARAYVLNACGVRSKAMLTVIDGASGRPLQNAVLSIDGLSVKTDEDGAAKLSGIKLGNHKVSVHKDAFEDYAQNVRFDMRVVDLGDVTLKPAGLQLRYSFVDYLSGVPLDDVSMESGQATAKSDKKGKAVLTVVRDQSATIHVSKNGYRKEQLPVDLGAAAAQTIRLVPDVQAVFITKESGKYDVYKTYVDGKDRRVLLPGTGLETQDMAVLPKPDNSVVAVVSSRDEKRNSDGYLLPALTLVNTESGDQTTIEHAEQIMLLGWRGNTLVYELTVAGSSAANPNRQRIIAYDSATNKSFQLASANSFMGMELVGSELYYAVSTADSNTSDIFGKVALDGSAKKTFMTGNIWSMVRTDYQKFKLQTPERWYEYAIGSSAPTASSPESGYSFHYYVDGPDGKSSVRVEARDSNGVLLLRDIVANKDREIATQRNMQAPLYWLTDTIVVYRVAGASEVADYVVSVAGGSAQKLSDVSLSNIR